MYHRISLSLVLASLLLVSLVGAAAGAPCSPTQSVSKTLSDKSVGQVPAGALFWRVETFPTLAAAQGAVTPLGSAVEAGGRAWLITLGPHGGATPGATPVAELGPLTIPNAAEYKLRVQQRVSQPGCEGDVHTHPGAEAWYVLAGEQTVVTPAARTRVTAGQGLVGPAPGTPMQLAYAGTGESDVLTFLVLDASQPVSAPAAFAPGMPQTGAGGSSEAGGAGRWTGLVVGTLLMLRLLTLLATRPQHGRR